jgi:hypothetical protein
MNYESVMRQGNTHRRRIEQLVVDLERLGVRAFAVVLQGIHYDQSYPPE